MAGYDDQIFANLPRPRRPGQGRPLNAQDIAAAGGVGTLAPANPSWSERIGGAVANAVDAVRGGGDREGWQNAYDISQKLAGLVPGLGQALSGNEAYRQGQQGNYGHAALAALGAVPIPGAKAVSAAGDVAETAAREAAPAAKLFDYSGLSKVPDVPQFDLPRYNPPRGVPARIGDLTSNPDVRQGMLDTIQRGQEMGGADWYNADPLRQAFIDELGKSGDPRFKQYMDLVAATSPRSDVGTNVRNASYYYNRLVNGEPMPDVGTPNPQPYGHMAQRLHQQNAQTVAGGGWDPLRNPKPASFAQDLTGNQQPVAVDTHAFRLPGMLSQDPRFLETAYQSSKDAPKQNIQQMVLSGQMSMEDALKQPAYWQAQPKANEYEAMEQYYQGLAQDRGISPAQAQAAAWVGGGQQTGLASDASKPFIGFVEDRANKTADVRGLSPAEALSQFIRGKAPLLGVGGAGAAAIPWWQQWQQGQDQQQGGGYGQPSA